MRRQIILIWSLLDPLYYSCTRLQCLQRWNGSSNILRIRLTRYKGNEVILSDGTTIQNNDLLIKIHLHNIRLLNEMIGIEEPVKKAIYVYKRVHESMPALAMYLLQHRRSSQIKGIIGVTMLNKGFRRLGFESVPISNLAYVWMKRISQYSIHLIFSPKIIRNKKALTPHFLFMSKEMICKKYPVSNSGTA